jgi:putative flippase GtrA
MRVPQFVLFVAAGGTAALANFGSRFLFDAFMPYVPAIVLAYGVGMVTAFLLNRAFVFTGANNPVAQQAFWFVAVNLAAVVQTVMISVLFARWVFPAVDMAWHPEAVAHAIGVIVPVFTSYIGHRRLTFRD